MLSGVEPALQVTDRLLPSPELRVTLPPSLLLSLRHLLQAPECPECSGVGIHRTSCHPGPMVPCPFAVLHLTKRRQVRARSLTTGELRLPLLPQAPSGAHVTASGQSMKFGSLGRGSEKAACADRKPVSERDDPFSVNMPAHPQGPHLRPCMDRARSTVSITRSLTVHAPLPLGAG